jgi:hypothetical protein
MDERGQPLQAPTPAPIARPTAQSTTPPVQQPAQSVAQDDSWWSRAKANFQDAWRTGTLAGATTTAAQTGLGADPAAVAVEKERQAKFEAMPSWTEAPDAMTKLKNFSAMIAGQVAGSMASPESLIAAPVKGAVWAVKGGTALERLGRRAAVNAGTQAAVGAATDAPIQALNMASGVQDEYSVERAIAAPVLGAAVGGVMGATGLSPTPKDAATLEGAIRLRETATGKKLSEWEREALDVARKYLKPEDYDKYAGNINLERIRAGEDVYTLIRDTAQTHAAEIEAMRRGTISNDRLREMASDLNMTPEQLLEMTKTPGTALNAETMLAARQLSVDAAVDASGASKLATMNPTPENMARALEATDLAERLIIAVSNPTAESGRVQQQFNINVSGEDRVKALQFVLDKNPELRDDAQAKIAMIASLEDPAALRNMLRQLAEAKQSKTRSTFEKVVEAWKAGLLTSFRTHEINMLSNSVVNLLNVPTEALAAGIGKVRSAVTGGEEGRSMTGALARVYGTFVSPNDQLGVWANFKEAMKTAETPKIFATKGEPEGQNAILGKTGEVIRTPFRLLTAEDAFFKTIAARQELTATAWDAVMKLRDYKSMSLPERAQWVNDFIRNPPKKALEQAQLHANYLTFNKELGKLGRDIQALTERQPAWQFIVPFVRTPINIVKYGFEHTPLVLINPKYRNLRGADADRAMAKAVMGSSFMLGMYGLAQEGRITGAGPIDTGELMQLKEPGWQPYSIKIGDKYYPYERLQPVGMLMGIAADMQYMSNTVPENASVRDRLDKDGVVTSSDLYAAYGTHIFMENVVNSTFTTQINSLFEAMNDTTGNQIGKMLNSLAGSVVPNIVADVAKAVDPTVREVGGPLEAIQARIPGASSSLPAKIDWKGEERVREHGPVAQMISPFHATTQKEDKTAREVARIGYSIPQPPKTFGNRELTTEQRNVMAQAIGQYRYNALSAVVNSPGYDKLASGPGGDEKVRRAFAAATANATKAAEAALLSRFPELAPAKADETVRAFGRQPRKEQPALTR